jgi:hypothetical protein
MLPMPPAAIARKAISDTRAICCVFDARRLAALNAAIQVQNE